MHGNFHFGEKIIDVLLSAIWVHQQEQVDTVAGGDLYPREKSRGVFHAVGGLLQLGDACGSIMIRDRDSLDPSIVYGFNPALPVLSILIRLAPKIIRFRGMRMEVDTPPTGAGPIPKCTHKVNLL